MFPLRFRHLRQALGHRAFIALCDQGAVSIASFVTGMLLSRAFIGPRREQLGLYYLAFTIGILIVELQNALVSTPHTVIAPTLNAEQRRQFNGSALIHHGALSLLITALLALLALGAPIFGMPSHAPMLTACAVTAGAVGLRNFARFLNFALHRPHIACLGDIVVTILQLGGILLLGHAHWLSAWSAVAATGLASFVGGGLALLLSAGELRPRITLAWPDFRRNWRLSRWVFASGVIGNTGVALYPWIIDRLNSTLQTALFGNCSTIASAGNPLVMGLQNWIGPSIAHAYARQRGAPFRRHVLRAALLFLLLIPPMLLVLRFIATPMLHHLYHDYSPGIVPLVLLLAVGSMLASVSFAITRGLFSIGRGRLDTWANAMSILVLFTVAWPLVRHWGAIGAAISLLIAQFLALSTRVEMFWMVTAASSPSDQPESAAPLNAEAAA